MSDDGTNTEQLPSDDLMRAGSRAVTALANSLMRDVSVRGAWHLLLCGSVAVMQKHMGTEFAARALREAAEDLEASAGAAH